MATKTLEASPPVAVESAPALLVCDAAAKYLGIAPRTLANWRCAGDGPPFYRIGSAIRYRLNDLDEWLAARRFRNTGEADASQAA